MPELHLSLSAQQKASLLQRFGHRKIKPLDYGKVADFCESSDFISQLAHIQGDLKDLQRPEALKLVLGVCPPGSAVLEVGAGEPFVAHLLTELGYAATVVDPYDGSGRGPTEFEFYRDKYPSVRLVRDTFSPATPLPEGARFDCIYSISVLEHVHPPYLESLFAGVGRFLAPGGHSIHLIDHVLQGQGDAFHRQHLAQILRLQSRIAGVSETQDQAELESLLHRAATDLETYLLSAEGHNRWRGATPYADFPFRKVISVHSCRRGQ